MENYEFERWNKCYHNWIGSSCTFSDTDNVVPTKCQNLLWTRSWQSDTEKQSHLEDGLKFVLSVWIKFQAGKFHNTTEMRDFPRFLQRSCVCSHSPSLSESSRNVPAHLLRRCDAGCWTLRSYALSCRANPCKIYQQTELIWVVLAYSKNWWGMSCNNCRKNPIRQWTPGCNFFPTFPLQV